MRLVHCALAATLLATACAAPPSASTSQPLSPSATPSPEPTPVHADGLLVAIRTARHDGFDRLVFEFGGAKAPRPHHEYVDAVTHDPSDQPVPLRGKAFVSINLQDATLDTAWREPDPGTVQRYPGPTRIAPGLPLIQEVAVSGDFEAVLSFGVGLSRKTEVRVQTLISPARVVFDFVH